MPKKTNYTVVRSSKVVAPKAPLHQLQFVARLFLSVSAAHCVAAKTDCDLPLPAGRRNDVAQGPKACVIIGF